MDNSVNNIFTGYGALYYAVPDTYLEYCSNYGIAVFSAEDARLLWRVRAMFPTQEQACDVSRMLNICRVSPVNFRQAIELLCG